MLGVAAEDRRIPERVDAADGAAIEIPRPFGSAWLIALLLTTFVIGTDDFMIAGILPAVSSGLAVSEAAAGQLVTVFSLTYAVAAPVAAAVTARIPRKQLLVGGLAVFALINFLTAFAPDYPVLTRTLHEWSGVSGSE